MADVTRVIFSTTFVLFMARKERRHSLDCFVAHLLPIGQACRSSHATTNALLAGFLRGQSSFAMLLAKLKATASSSSNRSRRGEALSVSP